MTITFLNNLPQSLHIWWNFDCLLLLDDGTGAGSEGGRLVAFFPGLSPGLGGLSPVNMLKIDKMC